MFSSDGHGSAGNEIRLYEIDLAVFGVVEIDVDRAVEIELSGFASAKALMGDQAVLSVKPCSLDIPDSPISGTSDDIACFIFSVKEFFCGITDIVALLGF